MHRNFNDLKTKTMTALEFIKKNYPKYNEDFVHTDIEINGCRLEELLEEYHQAKLKLLGIAIVSGSYYWVKCFTDDKYEPAVAVNLYNNGTMYFKFLNGAVRKCRLVADYKELNYR